MRCQKTFCFLALAAVSTVWGYVPPVDEKDGVRVAIESFPQSNKLSGRVGVDVTTVRAAKSGATRREFPVTLSNLTATAVSGRLDVWLNEDWTVTGPAGALTLAPGEGRRLAFTATAKPSALSVLYPVHARFTRDGGTRETAAHPIAIFLFNNPKAPRNAQKAVTFDVKSTVSPADRAAGLAKAKALAREAIEKGTDAAAGRWRLEAAGATYGAGAVFGPNGLIDGALAFTDGTRDVAYDGFPAKVAVAKGPITLVPRAEIREEKGTLRVRWTIGAKTNGLDVPRIADLAPGAASERPVRFYAGFGNVYQNPKRFSFKVNGFYLSTRHIGVDYANGLSVVQAVDTTPRNVECDGERNICSLHVHHDVTFTFVPSAKGAFEAARRFRAVAGYRKSPGFDRLGSRQCLDQWEGDYRLAAEDLAQAAKYGLEDSFFIKHMWQYWGYDYRLPDIFPPAEDPEGFKLMREAARKAGILFCPHDNYTDIYPDADTYSYDLVSFTPAGIPQLAWRNRWRTARSFRWAPHAIHPWVRRNAGLLQGFCDPDGIFIDVLTCVAPFDYYDRSGRFHSKDETAAHWRQAFTEYREAYGKPDAITISEAGHDALIGTVDAGECDHMSGLQLLSPGQFDDSERTPWHDIVSHGYYKLLAGGVAGRYLVSRVGRWDEGGDAALHGYASDDYFCTCIMGGRNPMSDGPFSRAAVKTYWMQHDACAELGRAEFLDLAFADGDIHRQHSTFSDGGEVWVNRAKEPWTLPALGVTLPTNGYYAKTRTTESGVLVRKDGVRFGFAKSPAAVFVDARAPARPAKARPPRSRESEARDPMSEADYLRGWDRPGRQPQAERDRLLGTNRAHKPVDFGGIVTDGTFRFTGGDTITPLPGSEPFQAKIDLAAFGAKGRRVARVEAIEPEEGSRTPRWTQTGDTLTLDVDARAFAYRLVFGPVLEPKVVFYAPNIVRVTKTDAKSYAPPFDVVRMKPEAGAESRSPLKVEIGSDGAVTFMLKDGTVLLREDGERLRGRQWFHLDRKVPLYGFGNQHDDKFNRRMGRYELKPEIRNDGIPFVQTVRGWGLFWNTTSATTYIGDEKGFSFSSECGDAVDYYFIYGGTMDGTVAGMRALTGDVPMLPRWSYGYWQSRERYKSQAELLEVVRRYRELGIPLDGIVQDWQYWSAAELGKGGERFWNSTEWLNPGFPDPKGMVDAVHAAHAHIILSVWPCFGSATKPYAEFQARDLFLPVRFWPKSTRIYNAFSTEARDIYWKYLRPLLDIGIDGWWLDDTEPEYELSDRDLDQRLKDGGTFRDFRCAYPRLTVGGVVSRTRKAFPDRRVLILTRGASAGQQATGAHYWSGDTTSSWATLKNQPPAALGYSLSGDPNWNCDIGSFIAKRTPDFIERYVRFLQFGATLPMMRSHGTRFPREFYFFGKPGEPVYDAMVKAVKLRYRLLPYLYSLAWDCSHNRGTFLRAMAMDFPEDERTWDDGWTYLVGRALLTAPVTTAKPKQMCAYLPKGADWWNYFTGERVRGGRVKGTPTKLDEYPLYVRAGSIIPFGPDVQYVDEKPWDDLEVVVYPGADGAFTLYEDEGDGYGYEQGHYTETVFRWNDAARQLTVEARRGAYPGMLAKRRFRVKLAGSDAPERPVAYDGHAVSVRF